MALRSVAAGAAVAVLALVTPSAHADPIAGPIKVEIPSPGPGVWDPLDPPAVVAPDLDLLTLAVPATHPWMLFDDTELPALRQRVLGAAPDSVIGKAWAGLVAEVTAPDFTNRNSYLAGLQDIGAHRWGRDDLLSVAFVWQITRDDAYLTEAKQLLQYAVAISPDYGAPIEPGIDEFYIQRAHRLNGFALAYDLLASDLDLVNRLQLRAIVETFGAQHMAHALTAWWATLSAGSNIGGNNDAALGTAGLALWNEDPAARAWVVRSEQLVRGYFFEGFDPEGAGIEGVLYGNYGLRIPTFLANALSRAGHPGLVNTGGIDRQQEWFAYEVLPGGGAVNPINDARYYEINPVYTTWSIADGDNPKLSAWLFDNVVTKMPGGGVGEPIPTMLWYQPPDPTFDPSQQLRLAEDFSARGLVHVRSGWGTDDLMSSFETRQTDWGEGVHLNQDVGQFTLYSDGAKLVVDSRYANWLEKRTGGDPEAARSSESEAHNLVVADGRSQDFFGKGDLVGFASTARVGDPGRVDLAYGDARLAWVIEQPQVADRFFLHVRAADGAPDYIVVADRFVQGGGAHDYTSFLHTDWRNHVTIDPTDPGRVHIDSGEVPGVALDVTLNVAAPFVSRLGGFTPDDAEDWQRLGEDGRKTDPRLEVTSTAASYDAISVMVPSGAGEAAPPVRRIPAEGGLATVVDNASTHGVTDTTLLATGDGPVSAAGVETDARFATVRRGPTGVEHVAFAGGTYLNVDGVRVVETLGGAGTVAVDTASIAGRTATAASVSADPAAPLPATGGSPPWAIGWVLALALTAHAMARASRAPRSDQAAP